MGAAAATATDVECQKATEMPKQRQKGTVDEATIMLLPALLELEQSLRVAVVMGGGEEAGIGNDFCCLQFAMLYL